MLELRILNGLHRGATLPLDERALSVGADEDADVVLVDPGIEAEHATLTLTEQGWALFTREGAVLSADDNEPRESLELQPGDFARLGHVWVTVVDADEPWTNPPPEPVESEAVADEPYAQAEEQTDAMMEGNEPYRDSPLDDPQTIAAELQAAPVTETVAPPVDQTPRSTRSVGALLSRRSKLFFLPLGLATVLSACAAYTMTARTSEEAVPVKALPPAVSDKAGSQPLQALDPAKAEAPKPAPLSQMELREAFRKRLKEVDLLKRFDLKLKDNNWTMQAALDDDEAMRFERILTSFIQTHKITFPVNAKIGNAEAMLPFRITQVISGSNASVVTQDGNRLYIGDEYRGVRLVAIEGSHLKFEGDRKIKVKW
jgi:type III secretion protein D